MHKTIPFFASCIFAIMQRLFSHHCDFYHTIWTFSCNHSLHIAILSVFLWIQIFFTFCKKKKQPLDFYFTILESSHICEFMSHNFDLFSHNSEELWDINSELWQNKKVAISFIILWRKQAVLGLIIRIVIIMYCSWTGLM